MGSLIEILAEVGAPALCIFGLVGLYIANTFFNVVDMITRWTGGDLSSFTQNQNSRVKRNSMHDPNRGGGPIIQQIRQKKEEEKRQKENDERLSEIRKQRGEDQNHTTFTSSIDDNGQRIMVCDSCTQRQKLGLKRCYKCGKIFQYGPVEGN